MIEGVSEACQRWGYTGIEFVGVEPSVKMREDFMERVERSKALGNAAFHDSLSIKLVDETFDETASRMRGSADIVLLGHVLYYFEDKAASLEGALKLTRPGGVTLVVHQDSQGVPTLQMQLLPELRGSVRDMFTSEDIHSLLTGQLGGQVENFNQHSIDSFLDVSEILASTEQGVMMMSFCLEADHRTASNQIRNNSRDAFESHSVMQAEPGRAGGPFLKEPVSCFLISPRPQ
jgi:SAM-dependent methyltransferase